MTANQSAAPGESLPLEPQHLWSFQPDGRAAAMLSAEINRRLVESIAYLVGELGEAIDMDRPRLDRWLETIASAGRAEPLVHTLFHTLVAEMEEGTTHGARAVAERMLKLGAAPGGLVILPLGSELDHRRPVPLVSRFADLEEANRLDLVALEPQAVAPAVALIEEGLALVARVDPDLGAEFRALVSEIWLVAQAPEHRFTTAAVACFQNWGGLIVNPAEHAGPVEVVELIAHEATHLLLFAIALDEALLTNPPEERFHSPLRAAPRSMDGVFHATIVAARVIRAMLRLAETDGANSDPGREALERASLWLPLFEDGVGIIESGARLTPLGRRVLDDSKAFVAAHKAAIPVAAERREPAPAR